MKYRIVIISVKNNVVYVKISTVYVPRFMRISLVMTDNGHSTTFPFLSFQYRIFIVNFKLCYKNANANKQPHH